MRTMPILALCLLTAGCANQARIAKSSPPAPVVAAATPSKWVETRYEIRGYQEAANPALRHEAHAVYRRTRVPANHADELETVSRTSFAPASVDPLPASEELAAELASQKAITAELRSMQSTIADTERRMQSQYGELVRQSEEAKKLREQLQATRPQPSMAETTEPSARVATNTTEAKW